MRRVLLLAIAIGMFAVVLPDPVTCNGHHCPDVAELSMHYAKTWQGWMA